jgi:hypothetical protein
MEDWLIDRPKHFRLPLSGAQSGPDGHRTRDLRLRQGFAGDHLVNAARGTT